MNFLTLATLLLSIISFSLYAETKHGHDSMPTVSKDNSSSARTHQQKSTITQRRLRIGSVPADYYALEKLENMAIQASDVSHFLLTGPQKK